MVIKTVGVSMFIQCHITGAITEYKRKFGGGGGGANIFKKKNFIKKKKGRVFLKIL